MNTTANTPVLLSIQNLAVQFRMGKVDGVVQRQQAVGRDGTTVSFDIPMKRPGAAVEQARAA